MGSCGLVVLTETPPLGAGYFISDLDRSGSEIGQRGSTDATTARSEVALDTSPRSTDKRSACVGARDVERVGKPAECK